MITYKVCVKLLKHKFNDIKQILGSLCIVNFKKNILKIL